MSAVRRIAAADLRARLKLAEWLAGVARHIAGDGYTEGPITRAVVVMWGPDGPVVTWQGRLTTDNLRIDVATAIREAIEPEGMRPSDNAARWAESEAKEHAAKPFECQRKGGCGARFATERGRDSHEAAGQRAQDAEDRFSEDDLPFHAPAPQCYLPQGGSHCVCGRWPPDRRRPNGDWMHRHLREPQARVASLTVVRTDMEAAP